jgi:hypothetical protein
MTVTVKHPFVSTIPDDADTSIVRPSNWNADHTIVGLGTAAELNAGTANGVATLDASGKVPASQIPLQGDLNYQGTWNANTNTPTLVSGTGTKGYYYVVDVAGSTNLDGITDWKVGDWAIFNGTVWQKVDNTDAVTSVNGQVGTVVLTTTNIAEGTNEYFTTARARASVSAGTAISYDNSTGVITNSAPDQTVSLTGAGTTSISGTYPNFTITSNDEFDGDVVGPTSATDNAIARFDTTTGKLIQNSTVIIDDNGNTNLNAVTFDITPATLPTAEGTLFWDADDSVKTLSLVMTGGNAIQQIGEETYIRIKASATITEGQVIMFTGTLGGSGVLLGAPATGLTASTAQYVMGVATENIANNDFGYVTIFGLVRGINTSGGAESWVDGDLLYLNPAVAGGLTKTLPTAPNPKVQVCAVVNASSGASGSLFIRPSFGGILGQYEGDVQVTTPANGDLLIRNQTDGKWVNAPLTAGTAISVSNTAGAVTIANTAPDQVVSITGGGTTTVTGTYPNFTVSSDDQYDGTVTSVSGTGTVNGLTLTGTVTSSGNLTLGGTLDLSSPPTIGNTTPNTVAGTVIQATNGIVVNSNTVAASYTIPTGSSAMSAGPMTVASGQTVTVSSGSRWVVL